MSPTSRAFTLQGECHPPATSRVLLLHLGTAHVNWRDEPRGSFPRWHYSPSPNLGPSPLATSYKSRGALWHGLKETRAQLQPASGVTDPTAKFSSLNAPPAPRPGAQHSSPHRETVSMVTGTLPTSGLKPAPSAAPQNTWGHTGHSPFPAPPDTPPVLSQGHILGDAAKPPPHPPYPTKRQLPWQPRLL